MYKRNGEVYILIFSAAQLLRRLLSFGFPHVMCFQCCVFAQTPSLVVEVLSFSGTYQLFKIVLVDDTG